MSRVLWAWLREGCVSRMGKTYLICVFFTCTHEMLISEPKFSSLMVVCFRTGNAERRGAPHTGTVYILLEQFVVPDPEFNILQTFKSGESLSVSHIKILSRIAI